MAWLANPGGLIGMNLNFPMRQGPKACDSEVWRYYAGINFTVVP